MSGIRVTYTGLISLVGGMVSVFTGVIFTLIITRSVTPEEYGTWGLIIGLITYVTLIAPIDRSRVDNTAVLPDWIFLTVSLVDQ